MTILLSTSYHGPIQYYSKLVAADQVILERFEHYPKQTYRNRCTIIGANGIQNLTIPVIKGDELKIYTKDIRIDYAMNWTKLHLRSIESAYRSSPFYEYYIDEYLHCYKNKCAFLYDFNLTILLKTLEIIGLNITINESSNYINNISDNHQDFREIIHPKPRMFVPDPAFQSPIYHQVFEPKLGFFSNLSIIDLLFNTGPEALRHLRNSVS